MKSSKTISLLALTLSLPFAITCLQAQSTAAKAASKKPAAPAGASSTAIALKDPIAIVDGDKISKSELEKTFNDAVKANGMNPASITPQQKLQAYHQILDQLIIEKIVDKKSAGVEVTDADVTAEIEKFKKQFPSPEVFDAELKKTGKSMDELRANLKKSLRQTKWMKEQIKGKDEVTEADAQKFYNDNIKQFANPDMVRASHILFLIPQGAPDSVVKAKEAAAKAAIARANKGEDFGKLATELSEDPGSKQKGGDLNFFSKEQMVPEFANAAFSQKVGSVSPTPIKTKFGYHVIKVTEKKPAGTISFAEAKPNIMAYLQNQKRRQAFRNLIQQLRSGAKIENFLPAPAMPPMPKPGKGMPPKPAASPAAPASPAPEASPAKK